MIITETDGIIAFELHRKIALNEEVRRKLLMENMAALAQIKNKSLYKAILGDDHAPWSAYLGQLEIFYSRNETANYIRIYEKFIVELKIPQNEIFDVTRSRLFDMLPIVDASNVEELLSMAKIHSTEDWVNEMRVRRGKTSIDDCPHKMEEYEICKDCGTKHKKNAATE